MRSRLLFCLLATSLIHLTAAQSTLGEDWPRWRGPRADGTWKAPPLPARWPEGGPREQWRVPIGGGYAGISVVGDRVYTMDRQQEPQEVERVLCFDAASGKLLWQHAYPVAYGDLSYGNGPRAAPTVHQGRVYTLGAVGHAHCLDAATGEVIWKIDLVGAENARLSTWGMAASPVIYQDLVILHAGVRPDGCFTAHQRSTGREVWRAGSDPAGYCTPILVDSPSGKQLIGWTPEHILGLAPASGEKLWSIPYKITYGVSIATPIYQQGLVLVAGYWHGSKAVRLGENPSDAELAWEENRYLRGLMSQPLYRDGYAYLLDKQHGLTCFRLATGEMIWNQAKADLRITPRDRNPQAALVWLGEGDRAIILNAEGELILARINPAGYHEQDRAKIIGKTWAHPAFAGRFAFARSDEQLVCVELAEAPQGK